MPSQPRTWTFGALLLVVVLDALGEAVHEDGDRREVHAAEGADDAGLRVGRGRVAGEERRLGGVEDDRLDVLEVGRAVEVEVDRVVDRDVLDVGVRLGRLGRGRASAKPTVTMRLQPWSTRFVRLGA